MPRLVARLADVGGPRAEGEEPLELGVLVAVGGVDVEVQRELAGTRVGARAEDEGRLRAAEPDVGRADLDRAVLLAVELDVAEDVAPEPGEQLGVGAVEDQLADAGRHASQPTGRRVPAPGG